MMIGDIAEIDLGIMIEKNLECPTEMTIETTGALNANKLGTMLEIAQIKV